MALHQEVLKFRQFLYLRMHQDRGGLTSREVLEGLRLPVVTATTHQLIPYHSGEDEKLTV